MRRVREPASSTSGGSAGPARRHDRTIHGARSMPSPDTTQSTTMATTGGGSHDSYEFGAATSMQGLREDGDDAVEQGAFARAAEKIRNAEGDEERR